jgi:hypothetical protein
LINIRDEQLKVFEQMSFFQQRILCHRLPQSLDECEDMTDLTNNIHVQNKSIQEAKRRQLDRTLKHYETQLLDYDHLYEQEWYNLEIELLKQYYPANKLNYDQIIECLQNFLNHRQYRTIRTIRYREACMGVALRKIQRRHMSKKTKNTNKNKKKKKNRMIEVYPQVIVDTSKLCLNQRQLDYLSHRGNLIFFSSLY